MKLPNAHLATVPERKVTHYLLNPAHPAGGSKASFFLRFGFTVADRTSLNVRTAWYIYPSSDAPRFVTAHPLPKL